MTSLVRRGRSAYGCDPREVTVLSTETTDIEFEPGEVIDNA
jgi:hypothetical protein